MSTASSGCAYCASAAPRAPLAVVDDTWSRVFGGDPVMSVEHGWYRAVSGDRVDVGRSAAGTFFPPHVSAVCDHCVHGWIEDLRWRAEPTLLPLAHGRPDGARAGQDLPALMRWACLTATLAELVPGLPTAASFAQREALRRAAPVPLVRSWFFQLRERLPARVRLSQVTVSSGGFVQLVSVDIAHFSTVVVLPSDEVAEDVVRQAWLDDASWPPPTDVAALPRVSLAQGHPRDAVLRRLCDASA